MTDKQQLLSDFKFYSSYSKFKKEDERMETWEEAIDRVMQMHYKKYQNKITPELQEYLDFATKQYKEKRILGSQRALQFGGDSILKHEMKQFNCLVSYCDRIEFFKEAMYLLLCGCGVGFSVQTLHVEKLPMIGKRIEGVKTFLIEDSIEGWADAIGVLLASYSLSDIKFQEYYGYRIDFDYSNIRPKGSYISGGFKAPGYEGLKNSLTKIQELLDKEINGNVQIPFKSIIAYDVIMHMADAVLSGGVRRSATICLFSATDNDMLNAKTGDWYIKNPQRGRSNNSVILIRNKTSKELFSKIMESVKSWGEPGFVWSSNEDIIYNPCVEIGMTPYYIDGNEDKISGWEGCVTYETKLLTKNGIIEIGKAFEENKTIEIWNGEEWSKVTPIKTGENREFYRVLFNDGSYLDTTENHKFIVKNRFEKNYRETTTKNLINELKNTKYKISVPRTEITENFEGKFNNYAYDYGYILGDGTVYRREKGDLRSPSAEIYSHEWNIIHSFSQNVKLSKEYQGKGTEKYKKVIFKEVDRQFAFDLKYLEGLPNEIFSWNRESIKSFIAGWIDSDGTKTTHGFRIYGREDKIRDLQLLLTKLNIYSSVNLMSKKGSITNFATRKNDVWYVQVSDPKDLWSNKIKLSPYKQSTKNKNQVITSVTKLDRIDDSYCFEEKNLHQGVFNNVLTKQCNLTEINGSKCNTEQEFYDACKASAILGTLQAGYTNFKYVTDVTKKIFDREALLGCSITGFMNNPMILFNPEIQKKGAEIIKETNKIIASFIGINQAARTTCVKPSGNASVILGTASGIHGEHSKKYFRNVQVNKEEELGKVIKILNPKMVENSLWSNNNSDWVISFPINSKEGSIYKKDLYGVKQLEYVKLTQQNWVEFGTNYELCVDKNTRHNVSNTIVVDDWDEVENYIYENKEWFAGISLLGMTGDKDYAQAPFTEVIDTDEIIKRYGKSSLFASGLIVDGLHAFRHLWLACNAVLFSSEIDENEADFLLKNDWIRRAKQFADRYFNSDIVKMTNCLKDISLYHKWLEINREYKDIDFNSMNIKPSYTDIDKLGAIACSGDQCTIQL